MKHKFSLIWRVAVALVLVLSFSLVAAVPAVAAAPTTVWVDDDGSDYALGTEAMPFKSIQKGINVVAEGGTVYVAPGTYTDPGDAVTDATVEVDKALTLKSTGGKATTIIADATQESRVVEVKVEGVTIDGFTIKGDGVTEPQYGIYVHYGDFTIQNNNFIDIINENIFVEGMAAAITSGTIDNNILIGEGASAANYRGGIWVQSYAGTAISGVTISNNTLSDFGTTAASPDSTGINVAAENGAVSDITITGNTVTDSCTGLCLWKAVDSIDVTDNTFSGCQTGVTILAGAPTNLLMTHNDITANTVGGIDIAKWDVTNAINYNNIYGNTTFGINNTSSTLVDAENNWWGAVGGPDATNNTNGTPATGDGGGDAIGDYVDADPWLIAPWSEPVTTISFESGWNLTSLPLYIPSANRGPATLLADVLANVDIVWGDYDSTTHEWNSYDPTAPTNDLTEMRDGKGYWVKMTAADILDVSALGTELPSPPEAPPSYGVFEGWNLIGFKSLTVTPAGAYLGAAVAGTFERMYGYDAVAGTYTTVLTGTELFPGHGYWLAVNADGTIYP